MDENRIHPPLVGFHTHHLADGHVFYDGHLPGRIGSPSALFAELWALHPADYHEINVHGRTVKTPRWQQAYGVDYHYTGRVNKAATIPPMIDPILTWCRAVIDGRFNGLLLNWYDAELGHYIGPHRDSRKNIIVGSPIVTVSLGHERVFRLRPWPSRKGAWRRDFRACDRAVFVMPWETNLAVTHEVPLARKNAGQRISITARCFSASGAK